MAYLRENKPTQAIAIFNAILKQNPQHAAALHMTGMAYYQLKQWDTALSLVKQSLVLQAKHPSWYQNLSAIYTRLGKIAEANSALQKSQQLKTHLLVAFGEAQHETLQNR